MAAVAPVAPVKAAPVKAASCSERELWKEEKYGKRHWKNPVLSTCPPNLSPIIHSSPCHSHSSSTCPFGSRRQLHLSPRLSVALAHQSVAYLCERSVAKRYTKKLAFCTCRTAASLEDACTQGNSRIIFAAMAASALFMPCVHKRPPG